LKRSLRFRLTVAVLAVLGVALGASSVLFYAAARHVLLNELDAAMLNELEALSQFAEEHSRSRFEFEDGAAFRSQPFEPGPRAAYFAFYEPDGDLFYRSRSLGERALARLPGPVERPTPWFAPLPDGRSGRYLQVSFVARWESVSQPVPPSVRHRVTVVVARETAPIDATLLRLRLALVGLGLVSAIVAGAAAAFTVSRGLRPAAVLAAALGRIDVDRLGERLAIEHLPQELEPAVVKLNEMLARLEESFARERRFTADVSHELRTPLAGLRMILEVASSRERPAADYRAAVADAMAVVGEMQAMVENLLMLARVDSHQIEVAHEAVPLRAFVDDCWRPLATSAAERRLVFANEVDPAVSLTTDRDKLRLIVGNLLSNAVAYTEEGGRVRVRAGFAPDVLLEVWDSGPAIATESLPRLFDRFFRGEAARSNAGIHCGIGLSLARGLGLALGVEISASNLEDGAVAFRLTSAVDPGAARDRPVLKRTRPAAWPQG
jgi:signal transduction histidine kinase